MKSPFFCHEKIAFFCLVFGALGVKVAANTLQMSMGLPTRAKAKKKKTQSRDPNRDREQRHKEELLGEELLGNQFFFLGGEEFWGNNCGEEFSG